MRYNATIEDQRKLEALAAKIEAGALAPADTSWNFDWADTVDSIIAQFGWAGLADACAFVDENYLAEKENGRWPKAKAAYRLPFKLPEDGELVAVWPAVKAATQAIRDSKAGLSLDAAEAAHRKLAAYWDAFGKQAPASPKQIKAQASPQKGDDDFPETVIVQQGRPEPQEMPRTIWVRDFEFPPTREFVETINRFEREDPSAPVMVIVDSYGGLVHDLLAMVAAMKTSKLEIHTCAIGVAMSCGSILLSCGAKGHRYAMPYSTVMVHEISSIALGNMSDLENEVEETKRLNKIYLTILAENCGTTLDEMMGVLRGDDGKREHYFSPEEAKAFGVVDDVVTDFSAILPGASVESQKPENTPEAGNEQ